MIRTVSHHAPSRCAVHALPGFTVPPLFTILCLMSLSLVIRAARPLRAPPAKRLRLGADDGLVCDCELRLRGPLLVFEKVSS